MYNCTCYNTYTYTCTCAFHRSVLTDIYNACDGIHWKCRDNWCTSSSAATNGTVGNLKLATGIGGSSGGSGSGLGATGSSLQSRSTTSSGNLLANNITVMRPALTNLANWYGIKLDSGGFIISITLRSNRLRGTIPSSIGLLKKLQYLDLSGNRLYGEVPSSIRTCTRLKDLYLAENRELVVDSRAELQSLIPGCRLRL